MDDILLEFMQPSVLSVTGTEVNDSDFGVKNSKVQGHSGMKLAENSILQVEAYGTECPASSSESLLLLYNVVFSQAPSLQAWEICDDVNNRLSEISVKLQVSN